MTYTYALMGVSKTAHDEIRRKLEEAGYDHVIEDNGILDMTHIGLQVEEPITYSDKGHGIAGLPRDLPTINDHLNRADANNVELWRISTATWHYVNGPRVDNARLLRDVRNDMGALTSAMRATKDALQSIAKARTLSEAQRIATETLGQRHAQIQETPRSEESDDQGQ